MISQLTGKYFATGHLINTANKIVYQNTDEDEPTLDGTGVPSKRDVPSKGDLKPELVHIRTIRSSTRAPNDSNIVTIGHTDSDSNYDSFGTFLSEGNAEQRGFTNHTKPTLLINIAPERIDHILIPSEMNRKCDYGRS